MKNHKGAIATLLTLALVVLGTLITLGTSLFVSNQKTNLASNSRASGVNPCTGPHTCTGNSNKYYSLKGVLYKTVNSSGGCGAGFSAGEFNSYCNVGGGGADTCSAAQGTCDNNCSNGAVGGAADTYCVSKDKAHCCKSSVGECNFTLSQAANNCENSTKEGCGLRNGVQTYKCIESGGGGGDGGTCQQQNESSNCNATDPKNGVLCPNLDCCFCKKNKLMVFASAKARVANAMDSACSNNNVVASYQADGPAFYCGGTAGSGGGDGGGGGGKPAASCTTPDTTCKKGVPGGNTNDPISIDKNGLFYEGKNCKELILEGTLTEARAYCTSKITGNCDPNPISCLAATNDNKSADQNMRVKTSTGKIEYFALNDEECRFALTEEQKNAICFPKVVPKCDLINCTKMGLGDTALDKSIYYSKEGVDGYFEKCTDTTQVDPIKCLPTPKPVNPLEYVIRPNDNEAQTYFCGIAANLITQIKYGKENIQSYTMRCQEDAKNKGFSSFNVVITDVDLESMVTDQYMHCCISK